jgi:hypothetical protein
MNTELNPRWLSLATRAAPQLMIALKFSIVSHINKKG